MSICLTQEELCDLTAKVRSKAQRKVLNSLGIDIKGMRPNGTLVVLRSAIESAQRQSNKQEAPDFEALNHVA